MMKIPGWQQKLYEYLEWHEHRPFQYGVNDCTTFMFGALDTIYGTDTLSAVTWQSLEDKAILLKNAGSVDALIAEFANAVGLIPIPLDSVINVGDMVAQESNDDFILGISVGTGVACMTHDGLRLFKYNDIKILSAWTMR